MIGELERIERRVVGLEAKVRTLALLLEESVRIQRTLFEQQEQILKLLQPPTDYPASTGGMITVTG